MNIENDVNWMLAGLINEDGGSYCDVDVTLNGEKRKINLQVFVAVQELMFQTRVNAMQHWIKQTFGGWEKPPLTEGQTTEIASVEFTVADDKVTVMTTFHIFDAQGMPALPDVTVVQQTEYPLTLVNRMDAFTVIREVAPQLTHNCDAIFDYCLTVDNDKQTAEMVWLNKPE